MSERKVVCQLRRARKLADWMSAEYPDDPTVALEVAERLPHEGWVLASDKLGFDHPASDDTVALTVELLSWRTEPITASVCACGHDAGDHDSLLGTFEVVGPCYAEGCACKRWAPPSEDTVAQARGER